MEPWRWRFEVLLALVVSVPLFAGLMLAQRFLPDQPMTYTDIEDHFKYGSTGGERNAGFPLFIWKALPVVFKDKLPQNGAEGYEAFGMIYENDEQGRRRELPVGVMRRRNLGLDRVFVNCALCHSTTVREAPDKPRRVYVGTGATHLDLGLLEKFFADIVVDERFNANVLVPAIAREAGGRLGLLDRYLVYPVAVFLMRERLLMLRDRFLPLKTENWGPGRVDTWNSAKAGLSFTISALPPGELRGAVDFPSIWNQRKRKHRDDGQPMQLHWTGNNVDVNERNLSAAFGTGATPSTVDHATPITKVGTDPEHYNSYTYELAANQNVLYAGTQYRFTHFRKTDGYANMPLDGIWLRGPYLHNGSVPTLRELLDPPESAAKGQGFRRTTFYRGYDVLDAKRVGFISDVAEENGRKFR